MCGEKEKRETGRTSREQGARWLRQGAGMGERQTFWGRNETENSAVGCALSRTVLKALLLATVHGVGGRGASTV